MLKKTLDGRLTPRPIRSDNILAVGKLSRLMGRATRRGRKFGLVRKKSGSSSLAYSCRCFAGLAAFERLPGRRYRRVPPHQSMNLIACDRIALLLFVGPHVRDQRKKGIPCSRGRLLWVAFEVRSGIPGRVGLGISLNYALLPAAPDPWLTGPNGDMSPWK
jgi:hypothetical protein